MRRLQITSLYFLLTIALFFACNKDSDNGTEVWSSEPGKHSYAIDMDGVERRLQIHIPQSYSGQLTPLVIMFHGSGGSGQAVYLESQWKELAEEEGFIVIFPTALEYFVLELQRLQTKWSAVGLDIELEVGTEIIDDIPFVQRILEEARAAYNIDDTRIYASGFSNGGGFCRSRIMTELSNEFAAIGTAGGIGLQLAVPQQSSDLVSLHTIMGTADDKVIKKYMEPGSLPIEGEEVMAHDGLRSEIDNICQMLSLDTIYSQNPEVPHFNTLTFEQSLSGRNNEYRIRLVNGMSHVYPNGSNHVSNLVAAELFWDFFQEHIK